MWWFIPLVMASASPTPPLAAPSAGTSTSCRAAVLDLKPGEGVTLERARALTEVVTSEVGATLSCAVISRAEIEALMDFEVSRQQGGCDTDSCLAELGEALGVSRLVLGTIQQVDGQTLVSLRLVDMQSTQVLRRVTDATAKSDAVIPFVRWLARRLILGDDDAGVRPVDDTRVLERQMSVWRSLAWASVVGAGIAGVGGGVLGASSLVVQETLPSLKSARGADRGQIEGLQGAGPWLAGGANLGLYVGAGLGAVAVGLFLLPADDLVERAP